MGHCYRRQKYATAEKQDPGITAVASVPRWKKSMNQRDLLSRQKQWRQTAKVGTENCLYQLIWGFPHPCCLSLPQSELEQHYKLRQDWCLSLDLTCCWKHVTVFVQKWRIYSFLLEIWVHILDLEARFEHYLSLSPKFVLSPLLFLDLMKTLSSLIEKSFNATAWGKHGQI